MKLNNFFSLNEQTTGLPIFSETTTGVSISNITTQKDEIKGMASGLQQKNETTNTLEFLPDVTNWSNNTNSLMYKFQQEFNKKYSKNTQNTLNLSGTDNKGTTKASEGSKLASQMLTAALTESVAEEIKRIIKLL
jgi:hypothetical protein